MTPLPIAAVSKYAGQGSSTVVRDIRAEVSSWFDEGSAGKAAKNLADHYVHFKPAKSGPGLKINDAFTLKTILDQPALNSAYQKAKADAANRVLDAEGVPALAGNIGRVKALLKAKVSDLQALLGALGGTTASGTQDVSRTVTIPDPEKYRQVLAVSDVHGMKEPLLKLLHSAGVIDKNNRWIAGKTLLIVNGDSIDKGPRSLGVLKLWMNLTPQAEASGGRIVHTLGNHEAELLANPTHDAKDAALLKQLGHSHEKISAFVDPASSMGRYIRSMPLAIKVGRWVFGHAGLFPDMSWNDFSAKADQVLSAGNYGDRFLAGSRSLLEADNWWKNPKTRAKLETRLAKQGVWGVVQGHQPDAYDIPHKIGAIDGGHLVKIDTGMAPEAGSHHGYMLRFPDPKEMKAASFPHLESLDPEGKAKAVKPRAHLK